MNFLLTDWIVLIVTLLAVIAYGVYKSRTSKNLEGYFLGNRQMPWWVILLSIMGTQASAVTFLTAPGQAYTDGMRFVQYYFGLPLAMIVVCIVFVPVFHKLKLFTAYEYLEKRVDDKRIQSAKNLLKEKISFSNELKCESDGKTLQSFSFISEILNSSNKRELK